MLYSEEKETGFKKLVRKYGIAYLITLINTKGAVYAFIFAFYSILSLFPDRDVLLDAKTDTGYLLLMLLNEVAAYLLPLISFLLIFGSGREQTRSVPSFADASGYKRYFGETAMLFVAGNILSRAGGLLSGYISGLLNELLGIPETQTAFSNSMPANMFQYISFSFCIVIIAPVCEELLYRHLMLKPMRRYGDGTAVLLTSLLFALSHFNFDQFLYSFINGCFLGIIAVRSGSCVPCIICHIINNIMATITVYAPETFGNESIDAFFDAAGTVVNTSVTVMLFVSLPVMILCIVLKFFRFRDDSGITPGRKAAAVVREPFLIIPTILMLIAAFIELYR